MVKKNYSIEKRQKDLAKRKKQEEKRQKKLNKGTPGEEETSAEGTSTETNDANQSPID
ncbi:MAG: hypothetical protein O9264_07365 [Leptospira sp.]|nr:hypothetical protein [Leptospira sp.]